MEPVTLTDLYAGGDGTFYPNDFPDPGSTDDIATQFINAVGRLTGNAGDCASALNAVVDAAFAQESNQIDSSSISVASDDALTAYAAARHSAWLALHDQNVTCPCPTVAGSFPIGDLISLLSYIQSGPASIDATYDPANPATHSSTLADQLSSLAIAVNQAAGRAATYLSACNYENANGSPPAAWNDTGSGSQTGGGGDDDGDPQKY